MRVVSRSGLPVDAFLWQPRADRWIFTVVCKATFSLQPGISPVASTQVPPHPADSFWNDDDHCSLRFAGDLVPFKRYPEILVIGAAWSAGGVPVPSLRVRLAVGSMDKTVDVVGDRFFMANGQLSSPASFTRMPLTWERAAGGPGTNNPVGTRMGDAACPDALGRVAVPNLQPPGRGIASRHDIMDPIGLGPVAAHWPSRVAHLPIEARGWDARTWRERPLPAGFDPWFFNVAPEDQQVAELRGGERLILESLHPEHSRIETTLARIDPQALVIWEGGGRMPVDMRCDTLMIDADWGRATLTWRGHVPLEHLDREGLVTVDITGPESVQIASGWNLRDMTMDARLVPVSENNVTALPFISAADGGGAAPPRYPFATTLPVSDELSPEEDDDEDDVVRTRPVDFRELARRPLPFQSQLLDQENEPEDELLDAPAQAEAASSQPRDAAALTSSTVTGPEEEANARAIFEEEYRHPTPPPPSLIGPLAGQESASVVPPDTPKPAPVESAASSAPSERAQPEFVPLPLEAFPLEKCATIAASVLCQPASAEDHLDRNGLTPSTWERLCRHWKETVREETRRGRTDMLRSHDTAFVAQLERERGPITPEERARLVVAMERDQLNETLAALRLPREAILPLERIYLARMIQDPKLRIQAKAALTAERNRA